MCDTQESTSKPLKHTNLLTHQHLHLHSQTRLVHGGCGVWTGGRGLELAPEFLNLEGWSQPLKNSWDPACHTGPPVALAGPWWWCQWKHSVQRPGRRWGSAEPATAGPGWWLWQWRWARMSRASQRRHCSLARCPQCSSQHLLTHTPAEETRNFTGRESHTHAS